MLENNQNKNLVLLEDLGMRFPTITSKQKVRYGLYRCYCGNEFETNTSAVKTGNTKSCGCTKTIHNLKNHRLYDTWNNMIQRCTNPKRKEYKNYGGRGIFVCQEWLDVNNFIKDMYLSFIDGLSLDRIDNDKGYSKDNCRWANQTIQSRNTRLLRVDNKSGYRGVCWHKTKKRWIAKITVNSKKVNIGTFINPLDGALAYDKYIIDNNLEHTKNFS